MPKLKTSKTAKKRIKVTSSGLLMRRRATRAHKLSIKSGARKREFTKEFVLNNTETKKIKKLIGV
ncbi:50S ribosomal protein L35 [Candidatus Nomurabacteria bacterium]|nr:50S ribosomal protein L35 [Candidatus Nomurabacteria bacterium]